MKRFAIFLMLLLAAKGLYAQPQSFSAITDTGKILIGEQLTLSLIGEVKEGASFSWPILPDSLNGLELVETGKIDTLAMDGIWKISQDIKLTSFDSGYAAVPPLVLKQSGDSLRSRAVGVAVSFPEVKEDRELYDIKEPMEAPFNWWLIIAVVVAAVLMVVAIVIITKWLKRRKKSAGLSPEQKLSPYEFALLQLSEIKRDELWQNGRVKEYYSRLTDVMRLYMERQLNMPAMESTADEVAAMAYELKISKDLKKEVADLLELSVLVKYAKQTPGQKDHEAAFQTVAGFIESTKPREKEETVKEEVASGQ